MMRHRRGGNRVGIGSSLPSAQVAPPRLPMYRSGMAPRRAAATGIAMRYAAKSLSRLAFVAVAAASAVPCQEGDEVHPQRQRVINEVLRKRDDMREGKVRKFNVRVRVWLHNESRLTGVVKQGRFVEKVDGLDFVEADVANPDAGLRLWYSDGTNSYIFVRYLDIARHRVMDTLSDEEVRAIEREVIENEKRLAAARQAQREQRKADKPGDKTEDGQPAKPAVETDAEVSAREALLAEFPPDDGWSVERAQGIERRRVIVGVAPDSKESRFLEVLEQWKAALAARQAEEAKKGGGKPPTEPGKPGQTDRGQG